MYFNSTYSEDKSRTYYRPLKSIKIRSEKSDVYQREESKAINLIDKCMIWRQK